MERTILIALLLLLAPGCETEEPAEPFAVRDGQIARHEQVGSILVVAWEQDAAGSAWLEFRVEGEQGWVASPATERPAGAAEELVLGMPYDAVVQVRVAWDGGHSPVATVQTGPLPHGAPVPAEVHGDPERWDASSPYVLGCIAGEDPAGVDGRWSFIVDRQGRTVWARPLDPSRVSLQTQLSADGTRILVDQNSFWAIFDGGAAGAIDRVDIEGNRIARVEAPGLHHPFAELPDGTLAWGAVSGDFNEEVLTLRAPDGTLEELWSCSSFIATEGAAPDAYCGSNTLSYSAATDTFLYSFFSLETVVEVDRHSGETVRYFGHSGDDAWAFDPPESAFWWQHGPHYTEAGTLLLSSKDGPHGTETVLVEYAFDDDDEALVEVFRFGDGEGVYGETMGEADYTAGGHILHNYGSGIVLREITPGGDVVWEVSWDAEMLGRTTPLSDLCALKP